MYLPGARGQQQIDDYYDYSGTITTGGVAQLALPQRKSCSFLLVANVSTGILQIQIGVQRAIATISGGAVTGVTVPDAGFGFTKPPAILFGGGGNANDPVTSGGTMPDWPSPYNVAQAAPIMGTSSISGQTIASIALITGGAGYLSAPYVHILADRSDPTGVGIASATAGIPLQASGGSYYVNGTACPSTAISIWGATTGQAYTVKWMP